MKSGTYTYSKLVPEEAPHVARNYNMLLFSFKIVYLLSSERPILINTNIITIEKVINP